MKNENLKSKTDNVNWPTSVFHNFYNIKFGPYIFNFFWKYLYIKNNLFFCIIPLAYLTSVRRLTTPHKFYGFGKRTYIVYSGN